MRRDKLIPGRDRPGFPMRMALLGSVSLLPMAAVFCAPRPAYAACPTVISSSVTGPVFTSYNCDLSVTNTGAISGGSTGVANYTALGTLSNKGSITASFYGVNNFGSIATLSDSGGGLISTNDRGIINQSSAIINALLIGTLSNTGKISADTVEGAYTGIINYGATIFQLSNGGTIQGSNYGIANSPGSAPVFEAYPEHALLNASPSLIQASIATLTNTGSITGGATGILNEGGFIGTLTNLGSIAGTISAGIDNTGTIGTINNAASGTVAGGSAGVANAGSIGNLTNSGSISSVVNQSTGTIGGTAATAVNNAGGTIGLLSNSGTITAGTFGVFNISRSGQPGVIATLTNTGTISGGLVGVDNASGTIFTLTSGGTIFGNQTGISNGNIGSIGTLTNTGSIGSYSHGIENSGVIGTIVNASIISGNTNGVSNYGAIGSLANSGTISGYAGIRNEGTLLALSGTNGGLITGGNAGISNLSSGVAGAISIGTLTNNGTISTDTVHGGNTGINNNGATIFQLSNGGTISGGTYGIANSTASGPIAEAYPILNRSSGQSVQGSIVTLTNTGSVTGGSTGIYNDSGDIGTLTNTGSITGINHDGIYNSGTIGTINNTISGMVTGIIAGGTNGIYNNAIIGTLSNAGTITGTGAAHGGPGGLAVTGVQNFDSGTITLLTNATGATISGGSSGIYNLGTILTLSNAGTITGGSSGIDNEGAITTLTNTGHISGGSSGIDNEGGSIGQLTNSGTITGTTGAGIYNNYKRDNPGQLGTIASLVNQTGGLISGVTGIYNANAIGTLSNSGSITGSSYGVFNSGSIGSIANNAGGYISFLDNTNTIGAGPTAIVNAGSIATLANSGTITGGNTAIIDQYNGSIGTLSNSGLISGTNYDGIEAIGTISQLTNTAAGTITGNNIGMAAGGSIAGLTNAGTITGGDYGIYLYGGGGIGTLTNSGGIYASRLYTAIDNEGGTIGALTNTGTIAGAFYGISNSHSIGTLTNQGTITGADAGFENYAETGTLTNDTFGTLAGLITGTIGVFNSAADYNGDDLSTAYIGTLTNGLPGGTLTADTIFGTMTGIANESTIAALSNNGTIAGGKFGIANFPAPVVNDGHYILNGQPTGRINQGSIPTLTNTGSITGGSTGIYNGTGYIGTLTNSGSITGTAHEGINTSGTIVTITNATGGTISGGATGIHNAGTISLLANSGSISGNYGVNNNGNIGTLSQSGGGTITGGQFGILNLSGGTIEQLTNGVLGDVNPNIIANALHALYDNVGTLGPLTIGTLAVARDTIHGGTSGVANAGGYIGTLTNNGTISGGDYGIGNYGGTSNQPANPVIATLTNNGLVTSIDDAISNYAEIGTLTNAGTIRGNNGIYNDGTITQLANNNLIRGTEYGLYNYYEIGEATNNDVILGITAGVYNVGTIAGLTNNGTILSGIVGVHNFGSIGTLTNTALITGGRSGIYNAEGATIGTLTNNGTIATDNGILPGDTSNGVSNAGLISQFTNTGIITGAQTGIYSPGDIGLLTNTGTIQGTIGNGLYLAQGEAINESGGVMEGGAAGIAIGTPSQQTSGTSGQGGISAISRLTNSGIIASHALTNDVVITPTGTALVFNQPGGLIEGAEGALFVGAGSTLINAGTIISTINGNAIDFGTVGGNFLTITTGSDILGTIYGGGTENQITLDGTGTLTNTIADFAPGSALNVAPGADWTAYGNWQINTVTNDGVFQPGILGTPLNLTGNFVQNPDGTLRVLVSPSASPFVTTHFNITGTAQLAGGVAYYFAPGTYTAGTIAFLSAAGGVTGGFTSVTYNNPPPVYAHSTLIFTADGDLRLAIPSAIVRPFDDSIFSDEIQSSAATAQTGNTALLNKASEGEAAGAEAATCAAEAAVTPADVTPGAVSGVAKLTNSVAAAICGAGGWIQATGTAMRAYGDSSVPSYDADTAGFLAGIDKPVNTEGLRLGLAVGYDETFLLNGAGSKGQVDTTRFGIFGSQPLGQFTLAGDFMFGVSNTTTNRVTGVGMANSTHAGDVFSGALQIETLQQINGINLIPQAGIRIAAVNAGGFDETGNNIVEPFSLTGAHSGYDSVQPFVNLNVSHLFLTGSGIAITPDASLGYFYEAGSRGRAVTLDARDGTVFTSHYVTLAGSAGQGEVGLSASKGLWSFYARYSADVAANWVSQTGEAGLHLRF